jgi:hypothetical protein
MSVTDSLFNSSFFGRDGYRYWIGKVPFSKTISEGYNWGERVPVRILGYHTEDRSILPDKDLPVAIIKRPTSMGSGNNASSGIVGGELVTGYFVDADQAQQPIIDGILGWFDKDAPSLTSAEYQNPGSGVNPFESSFPYTDNLPFWRVASEGKLPDLTSNTDTQGKESKPKGNFKATVVSDSTPYSYFVPSNGNTWEMMALKEEFAGPNNCGTDTISRIQVELSKVATILNGVKKYYALYVLGTVNKVYDFAGQINNIIENIAAILRTLIQRVRNWVLKQVRQLLSNAIELILGDVSKDLADSIVAKVLDILFCIFQTTIDELPGLIGDFLAALLNKLASGPLCAAEKFVNALINNVLGILQDELNEAMEEISGFLNGVLDIGGAIMDVIDQILGILGFLCLTKNCSEVTKFNSSPWGGPTKQQKDNYNEFLSKLEIPDPTAGALAWLEASGLGDTSGPTACDIAGGNDCTPPTVSIFGGNPTAEALASAVVSGKGNIIGVLLSQAGAGYKYPPFVAFDDPCNYGSGGAGYAEIDVDGGLTGIVITNPGWGYIDVPDGSNSNDPNDFAKSPVGGGEDGVLERFPIIIDDTENADGGGGTINPGVPTSGSGPQPGIGIADPGNLIDDGAGDDGFDIDPGGDGIDNTVIGADPGDDNGDSDGGESSTNIIVPVVGCLTGFTIMSTGYGYAQDDAFIITPPMPGLTLEGRYTDSGQLVEIVAKGEVCGWVEIPDVTINSKTGNGVRVKPNILFTEASEFSVEDQRRYRSSTLSVIQCTSKPKELVGYVNGQPYYGPYHIHKGRKMVGAAHNPRPHSFIFDTKEESVNQLEPSVIRITESSTTTDTENVEIFEAEVEESSSDNLTINTTPSPTPTQVPSTTPTPTPAPAPSTPSTPSPDPTPPSSGGGGYGGY